MFDNLFIIFQTYYIINLNKNSLLGLSNVNYYQSLIINNFIKDIKTRNNIYFLIKIGEKDVIDIYLNITKFKNNKIFLKYITDDSNYELIIDNVKNNLLKLLNNKTNIYYINNSYITKLIENNNFKLFRYYNLNKNNENKIYKYYIFLSFNKFIINHHNSVINNKVQSELDDSNISLETFNNNILKIVNKENNN